MSEPKPYSDEEIIAMRISCEGNAGHSISERRCWLKTIDQRDRIIAKLQKRVKELEETLEKVQHIAHCSERISVFDTRTICAVTDCALAKEKKE